MRLLAISGSSRSGGNTDRLTDIAVEGIGCTRLYLREHRILPIVDQRHDPAGFQPVDDDYDQVISQVLAHDVLLFATPLYWYGMSGLMKNFVDRWSQSLRDPRFRFREEMSKKRAYVLIVGGDSARVKAQPLVEQFRLICGYLSMPLADVIVGEGNQPGEVLNDDAAVAVARRWNAQFRNMFLSSSQPDR